MRTLYFDIDGTVLVLDAGVPKPALAEGRLERAIRRASMDMLVCVGNFAGVVQSVRAVRPGYDGLGVLFSLCGGAFSDETWFREHVEFVSDPKLRATEVKLDTDWWYMDDQAERYFAAAGRSELFRAHRGRRILEPSPRGDGRDVLDWLGTLHSTPEAGS